MRAWPLRPRVQPRPRSSRLGHLPMKSCPTCNRTYSDDTFTFCLSDGTLLSAPYDPQATLIIPTRDTDPRPAVDHKHTSPPEAPELLPTMPALLLERKIERPRTEATAEEGMSGATVATIVVLLFLSVVLTVFLSRC